MPRLVLYEACCDAVYWAVVMIASVFNMPLPALRWIKIVALVASHETGGSFFFVQGAVEMASDVVILC